RPLKILRTPPPRGVLLVPGSYRTALIGRKDLTEEDEPPRLDRTIWLTPPSVGALSSGPGIIVGGRLALGGSLCDGDQRRAKHPVTDRVTGLDDLDHGARRRRRIRYFVHGLVAVRIELLSERIELLDPMLLKHVKQFAFGEFDAVKQRLHSRSRLFAQF